MLESQHDTEDSYPVCICSDLVRAYLRPCNTAPSGGHVSRPLRQRLRNRVVKRTPRSTMSGKVKPNLSPANLAKRAIITRHADNLLFTQYVYMCRRPV